MKDRIQSLDALRGYAILTMVLSGCIAYAHYMPTFMFHAQVPPPNHKFMPNIAGITWVDLVFPFFLFSMGAAIPLSLTKKIEEQKWYITLLQIFQRGIQLAFFAFFTQHLRSYANEDSTNTKWLIAILGFGLTHFLYVQLQNVSTKIVVAIRLVALAISIYLLSIVSFANGQGFSLQRVDIIILLLADMAVFGSLIWWLTKNKPIYRLLVLPIIMGVFLSGNYEGESWVKEVYNFTPFSWLYKFYYLKYLFLIIFGTFAGEWLQQYMAATKKEVTSYFIKKKAWLLIIISITLIVVNLWGLFERHLVANAITSLVLVATSLFFAKGVVGNNNIFYTLLKAGGYLLLLGLIFEPFQGGIKKDFSTYSYYFVTGGLAFYLLTAFLLLEKLNSKNMIVNFLALNGKNPMVAYVAGNLLILPILNLTHTITLLDSISTNAFTGTLRGIIFTTFVSLVTILFVKRKWFWKG